MNLRPLIFISLFCLSICSCKQQTNTKKNENASVASFASTLGTPSGKSLLSAIKSSATSLSAAVQTYPLPSNLYFGYWGDGMAGTGNGNYIQQTGSLSNVHYISASWDGNLDEWKTKVLQAKANGNKAILMLSGALFTWGTVELQPNRVAFMQQLKAKLAGLEDTIMGIYLYDEPYWNDTLADHPIGNDDIIYANLKEAASLAKMYFPNTVIIVTEGVPVIGSGTIKFPPEIDWIGANCYAYYSECPTTDDLETMYHQLAQNFSPNQKMIFTLEGNYNNREIGLLESTQKKLIERNDAIIKMSAQFPTVAFFPFIYQSFNNNQMLGIEEMPLVKAYFVKMWASIKNGTFNQGNTCQTQDPTCEGKDWVRRDTCGNEIERWKNAPKPYCPATTSSPVIGGSASGSNPPPLGLPIGASADSPNNAAPTPTVIGGSASGSNPPPLGLPIGASANSPNNAAPTPTVIGGSASGSNPPPLGLPIGASANSICNVLEPKCEGKDYVRRDSCGKEIERWKNAPAPYCPGAPAPAPAPASTVGCTVLDPKCEGKDWVRRDSCGMEIGRWVNAPAPYCLPAGSTAVNCVVLDPKCEGKDWVRRDSCGKELGRWVNAPAPYCP